MVKTFSFTLVEKKLAPEFRRKVNNAETISDLRNLFSQTGTNLLQKALPTQIRFAPQDIAFAPGEKELFTLGNRLLNQGEIKDLLDHSDLLKVLNRFAKSLNRRYLHLLKHSQKTKLKIRK